MKFQGVRQIAVWVMMVIAVVLIAIPIIKWVNNPELTKMQVFLDNVLFYVGAIACLGWAKILLKGSDD